MEGPFLPEPGADGFTTRRNLGRATPPDLVYAIVRHGLGFDQSRLENVFVAQRTSYLQLSERLDSCAVRPRRHCWVLCFRGKGFQSHCRIVAADSGCVLSETQPIGG